MDHLAERRMGEPDGVVGAQFEDVLVEGRPDAALDVRRIGVQQARQEFDPGWPGQHGEHPQQRLRPLVVRAHPGQQQLVQGGGQGAVAGRLAQQVLDEQRVARGAGQGRPDEFGVRIVDQPVNQSGGVIGAQPFQTDPAGDRQPAEFGEPAGQQGTGHDRVRTVGRHQHQPFRGEVRGQVPQQVEGRPVRPVQVLDGEQHRTRPTQPIDQLQHRLEQRQLGRAGSGLLQRPDRLRRGPARQQAGQVGGELHLPADGARASQTTQGLDQRGERQRLAGHGNAAAVQQGGPLLAGRGAHQRGLADAGLAAEQHDRRCPFAGALERGAQFGQARITTDQAAARGGDGSPGHGLMMHPPASPRHT